MGEKECEVRRHLILLALHDVYKEPGSVLYVQYRCFSRLDPFLSTLKLNKISPEDGWRTNSRNEIFSF
jgi:hypothetical protein